MEIIQYIIYAAAGIAGLSLALWALIHNDRDEADEGWADLIESRKEKARK